jgi:glyoxylase-like metal-dependent hydrolase (beta-lactamase superfamily II)
MALPQRSTSPYHRRMSEIASASQLVFPRPSPPAAGEWTEIAPGILWLRLALPFALDHVNIYLLEDDGGWVAVDTGIADLRTRTIWQELQKTHRLTRLLVTHFHPDHVGLAGWLAETADLPLSMSQVEYLMTMNNRHNQEAVGSASHGDFYRRHGVSEKIIGALLGRGHSYLRMTTGLPNAYHRLVAGETLRIGGRDWEIITGGGHAPEQVMLYCRADAIFLAADQVLARISPNIGVWPMEPLADPLGDYLSSLAALPTQVADDVLVLPAHNLPFFGLHQRIADLQHHHAQRCAEIVAACASEKTTAEVLPVLFPRLLDPHQMGFAFGEVLAHVNHLVRQGELVSGANKAAPLRFVRA